MDVDDAVTMPSGATSSTGSVAENAEMQRSFQRAAVGAGADRDTVPTLARTAEDIRRQTQELLTREVQQPTALDERPGSYMEKASKILDMKSNSLDRDYFDNYTKSKSRSTA